MGAVSVNCVLNCSFENADTNAHTQSSGTHTIAMAKVLQ